jgi:exopolyphosphatase/guanosine-5'-triphosphate,3'-diphosphate pyrophosphatase
MNFLKLGAIDLGSNSIRCLVVNVIPTETYTHYKKASMTRLPVRLGADVFATGSISDETGDRLLHGLKAYSHIFQVHGVEGFRACATSAMREATNSAYWIETIRTETGIDVEVIDGQEEARLVFSSKLFDKIQPDESRFLFIDVGGGSTELTLFADGRAIDSISLPLGTVRRMAQGIPEGTWERMDAWIDRHAHPELGPLAAIGSGGNINKLYKLSGRQGGEPLSSIYLTQQIKALSGLTQDQLVLELGLNVDRADVLVPALEIYQCAMRRAGCRWIYVPKIGVADGIVRDVYHTAFKADWEAGARR